MNDRRQLSEEVARRVKRMHKARRERSSVLGQTVFLTTLGLIFVLPVVGGAYLGHWLDNMVEGYSVRWTLGLMFVGLIVGSVNVYLLIREK